MWAAGKKGGGSGYLELKDRIDEQLALRLDELSER